MGDPLKIMAVQWQQKTQILLLTVVITSLGELATNDIRNTEVQKYKMRSVMLK